MGKGDRRSLKGKRWRHSYGNTRKHKNGTKPAFVPKAKKEKKVTAPQAEAVEAEVAVAEAAAAPKAKKAPAAKKPAGEKKPAAKKATKKKE